MTANIQYLGGLRTRLYHNRSGAEIINDAPVDNRGQGQSFSPTDLMASSLASCILTIMGIYALDNEIDMEGTEIQMEKIMHSDPRKIASIKMEITFPNSLLKEDRGKLLVAAKSCPVSSSIDPDLIVELNEA